MRCAAVGSRMPEQLARQRPSATTSSYRQLVICCELKVGVLRGLTGKVRTGSATIDWQGDVVRGMTDDMTIGRRVAFYRRRRGLSQEVLAGLVGKTAEWLRKVET